MQRLKLESTIVASKSAVSCDLMGEAIILELSSGMYFGLDSIGAAIWEFIQEPRPVNTIVEHLVSQYEVTWEQCEAQTRSLLDEMANHMLIGIHENESAAIA